MTTERIYGGLLDLRDAAMAQAMASTLLSVGEAIVPAPTVDEVLARPRTRLRVRPGRRASAS